MRRTTRDRLRAQGRDAGAPKPARADHGCEARHSRCSIAYSSVSAHSPFTRSSSIPADLGGLGRPAVDEQHDVSRQLPGRPDLDPQGEGAARVRQAGLPPLAVEATVDLRLVHRGERQEPAHLGQRPVLQKGGPVVRGEETEQQALRA